MAIQILPVEQADLPECFDLAYESLRANNGPWTLVFPNGMIPADRDHWVAKHIKKWPQPHQNQYFFKAVNPDLPVGEQIVGVSRWVIYLHPDEFTAECAAQPAPQPSDYSPSMDPAYRLVMMDSIFNTKLALMGGQAFVYLQLLSVRGSAQRQGIGGLLVKWGVDKADELGLAAYVEASPAGRRVYEKAGFEVIREVRPDGKWASDESALHYLMLRPRKKSCEDIDQKKPNVV